jgi:predicted RNA binding protein with dsRBD fold (UPF0201 family)
MQIGGFLFLNFNDNKVKKSLKNLFPEAFFNKSHQIKSIMSYE